eukprot:TRINITY_DN170_c0_g1_i2.p2 TRINITY_DN170_c0_g1~~TRINITY_DN170_c0_g1_i2.p2  ORF type:complete len:147 (+),score=43.24 TRINITY_DN170_c0_g1_i2:228-668(+)
MSQAEAQTPEPRSPKSVWLPDAKVTEPHTCTVVFKEELPKDTPYGEKTEKGCTVFLKTPKSYEGKEAWSISSTYQQVGETVIETLKKASMDEPDWRISEMLFKTTPCKPTEMAQAGEHTVTIGHNDTSGADPANSSKSDDKCCVIL